MSYEVLRGYKQYILYSGSRRGAVVMSFRSSATSLGLCILASLILLCPACERGSPSADSSNVPDEATYAQSIMFTASDHGDHFLIEYDVNLNVKFEDRYQEVVKTYAIFDNTEVYLCTDTGPLGGRSRMEPTKESILGGRQPQVIRLEIRYEIWDGKPQIGTLLFSGKKLVDISDI
jgi:hypothetical protein